MFRLCFVWVYIIKGFLPFVKLASIGRLCKCTFSYACRIVSYVCPKSFYIKGNKNGLLRVLLSCKFLRQYAVLSLLVSERLEMTDQRFKQARQRSKNVVWRQVYFVVQIFRYCTFTTSYSDIESVRSRIAFRRVLIRTDFLSLQVGGSFISDFFAPFFKEESFIKNLNSQFSIVH